MASFEILGVNLIMSLCHNSHCEEHRCEAMSATRKTRDLHAIFGVSH